MKSPQVARKSTCQRETRNNHGAKKIQQNVSKVKPTKLATIIRKRSPRKQNSPVVQSDVTSSADEMPLNNRLSDAKKKISAKKSSTSVVEETSGTSSSSSSVTSISSSDANCSSSPSSSSSATSISSSDATCSSGPIFKRPLAKETKTYVNTKRARNKKMCKELFEKCDERTLFQMMVEKFDAEKILQGYKEKRNAWDKKEMIEEAARVFDVNLENQSITNKDAKLESLRKVLKELSNLTDLEDEIVGMVLKMYGDRLKPEKVFELLDRNEIKQVLLKNFTASEFLELFKKTDNAPVIQQILEMASVDAIVSEVKARNDTETSLALLKVLLESSDPAEASSNASVGLTGAIIDIINSKNILKTSEDLLNFMLNNVGAIVSKETKNNLIDFFTKKFSAEELMDLFNKAMKSILNKSKKVALIDISN